MFNFLPVCPITHWLEILDFILYKKTKGKYAWTVTVGEKGQIVIPKQAREVFDIHPGDSLIIPGDESKGLTMPLKSLFARFASAVFETEAENEEDLQAGDMPCENFISTYQMGNRLPRHDLPCLFSI